MIASTSRRISITEMSSWCWGLTRTANITEVPQEYTCPKVTGEVTYNGKEDLDGIAITAVYKLGDKSVYAYTTYLQSIESGSTESFEINPISTELPDHDSVEVYVQNW